MKKSAILLVFVLAVPAFLGSQQVRIIPAVTDEVYGLHNSRWETEVLIIKKNPNDSISVKRKWVCVPEGGFSDEPSEAPEWNMESTGHRGRILRLDGEHLLYGSNSKLGAVALEIEGGEVIVVSRVIDARRGLWGRTAGFGQGQLLYGMDEPLVGSSHIPWLGGCLNGPCSTDEPINWNFYRNNIGFVNPNPTPIEISGVVIPFGGIDVVEPTEIPDEDPETFKVEVPPFGWVQFNQVANHFYGQEMWGNPIVPSTGFVIGLTPNNDNPYYAYVSVVFTPDPDSGYSQFNDPMFVPAEPGFVAPIPANQSK